MPPYENGMLALSPPADTLQLDPPEPAVFDTGKFDTELDAALSLDTLKERVAAPDVKIELNVSEAEIEGFIGEAIIKDQLLGDLLAGAILQDTLKGLEVEDATFIAEMKDLDERNANDPNRQAVDSDVQPVAPARVWPTGSYDTASDVEKNYLDALARWEAQHTRSPHSYLPKPQPGASYIRYNA